MINPADTDPLQQQVWVARLQQGDPDAWTRLCEEYGQALFLYLYHRCGGNPAIADEVRQETFVAAVEAIQNFRGDSPLFGWLCRIARNKAADQMRGIQRDGPSLDGDEPERWLDQLEREPLPEEVLSQKETLAAVVEALWLLPGDQRAVLLDRYVRGKAVPEIAQRTGRSYKGAESLLSRAREGMRRKLKEILNG